MAPFPQARSGSRGRRRLRQAGQRCLCELRARRRRRLDRAGASRRSRDRRHAQSRGGENPAPRHRAPLQGPISTPSSSSRARRKAFRWKRSGLRPVEAVATLARSVAIEMDFRLEAAALSEMAENTREDADFRVPTVDWDRTAREVLTLEWIDGTPLNDHAALGGQGLRPAGARPQRDPELPAPCLARRLLPRRHASRQSVRRRRAASWWRSTSASWDGWGRRNGGSWPKSCSASSPAIITAPRRSISTPAMCRATIRSKLRAGDPRHRRADPQPHRRRYFDGQAVDAAVRGHRPVRHAHAAGTLVAAKDHGGGGGRRRARSIPSSTCGLPPSRWCANGSSVISAPPAGWKTSPRAPARSAAFSARCPALLDTRRHAARPARRHHARRPGAVAGNGGSHRPRRAAPQPLDRGGAVGDRGVVGRGGVAAAVNPAPDA